MRTNPTQTLTVRDFAAAACSERFQELLEADAEAVLEDAERRGMELARRLGVDRADKRLPVYIWAIIFGQSAP